MITSEMIVCRIKSEFAIMCTFTWQFKNKKEQQSFIISLLLVWNSFIITLNLSRNYGQVSAVVILAAMLAGARGRWRVGPGRRGNLRSADETWFDFSVQVGL